MGEYLVTAEQYFKAMTSERLEREIAHYQLLVDIEFGHAPRRFNRVTGKEIPYTKSPHMLPAMEKGLTMAKEELAKRTAAHHD